MFLRYSWLAAAACAVLAAGIAARAWAPEIRKVEAQALDALGVPVPVRLAGVALLVGLYGYGLYARSKREAARTGVPVIRRSVAVFALGSIAAVVALVLVAAVR
jgi:hypothetical protein